MKPYKEYNFTDWINLSEDLKRYSGSLDSLEPEIGEKDT
jgi:hypothetical protein